MLPNLENVQENRKVLTCFLYCKAFYLLKIECFILSWDKIKVSKMAKD